MSHTKFLLENTEWPNEDNFCYSSTFLIISRYPLIFVRNENIGPLNHPPGMLQQPETYDKILGVSRHITRYISLDLLDKDEFLISNYLYTQPYIITNKRCIEIIQDIDLAPWNKPYDIKCNIVDDTTFKLSHPTGILHRFGGPISPETYKEMYDMTEYIFKYDKDKHNLLITTNKSFAIVFKNPNRPYIPPSTTTTQLIESPNLPLHQQAILYKMRKEKELDDTRISKENEERQIQEKKHLLEEECKIKNNTMISIQDFNSEISKLKSDNKHLTDIIKLLSDKVDLMNADNIDMFKHMTYILEKLTNK